MLNSNLLAILGKFTKELIQTYLRSLNSNLSEETSFDKLFTDSYDALLTQLDQNDKDLQEHKKPIILLKIETS